MSAESFGDGQRVEVVLIYPSLLGTYGDRGNATVLGKRLAWRGYDPVLTTVEPGEPLPDSGAVYLLGSGEDAAQISAVQTLHSDGTIYRAADRGAAIFGVDAGYQMLGNSFPADEDGDGMTPGLGLLDITTTRGHRAVGELLARWCEHPGGEEQWLTGFENHYGRTHLGPRIDPVSRIEIGVGNGDGTDGARRDNVLGIYPHGPALARNPALADHLLEIAVRTSLPPLDRPEITKLRHERIAAARQQAQRSNGETISSASSG